MVKNKNGWLRIMEATIAIMVFSSVLLIIYSQQTTTTDLGDNIYVIQRKVLNEISLREDLRNKVLEGDKDYLNEFAKPYFPFYLDYSFEICRNSLQLPQKLRVIID